MKVVVSMTPARNEEKYLKNSLTSLTQQTRPLDYSVVVNDGSTDKTEEIIKSFGLDVINLEDRGYNVYDYRLAPVVNAGILKATSKLDHYDYIILVAPDCILPLNYVEEIINRMETDDIAFASGVIKGTEENIDFVRGAGRVIRRDLLEDIGGCYPEAEIWESYINYYVTYAEKYRYRVYKDLVMEHERPSQTNYNPQLMYVRGMMKRSLGVSLWQNILMIGYILAKHKSIRELFRYWKGYLKKPKIKFPEEIQKAHRKFWGLGKTAPN